MTKEHRVEILLDDDELARLDELRPGGMSRGAFVRELLRQAGPLDEAPTYEESVRLLAQSARAQKVQAQVALERALREEKDRGGGETELDRILRGD
jgi:ribbon-helix-helix CopG family protein